MSAKKMLSMLLLVLCMATVIHAQSKGTIVYTILQDGVKIDPDTGEYPDMPYIYLLEDAGYEVIRFYNASLATADQATLDTLNNANLIILGRSTPSTDYGNNKYAWNELTTPILALEMWALRNNRLNWFNTTNMVSLTAEDTVYNAIIDVPDDPVFEGLDTSAPVPWAIGPIDAIGVTEAGNGTVLARMEDNTVLFVRFEPYIDFYDGAGDYPSGYRTMIGNGRDNSGQAPFHYYTFTEQSEKVFLAEVARMVALGGGSAVKERKNTTTPSTCVLSQNYPNPFNPTTTIPFDLSEKSHVRLSLTNILGKEIREIVNGEYGAGHHEIVLDAANLAAGIYFYKIETEGYTGVKKLAVVK
jgi:hypothetical protein